MVFIVERLRVCGNYYYTGMESSSEGLEEERDEHDERLLFRYVYNLIISSDGDSRTTADFS